MLKNTINNGCYTTNNTTDLHTVPTTDIKQTCVIYIYFLYASSHTSNNKILCTPLLHINSFEEIFPRLTHIGTSVFLTDPAGVMEMLASWTEKLTGGPQARRSDCPTDKGQGSGYTTSGGKGDSELVIYPS